MRINNFQTILLCMPKKMLFNEEFLLKMSIFVGAKFKHNKQ